MTHIHRLIQRNAQKHSTFASCHSLMRFRATYAIEWHAAAYKRCMFVCHTALRIHIFHYSFF